MWKLRCDLRSRMAVLWPWRCILHEGGRLFLFACLFFNAFILCLQVLCIKLVHTWVRHTYVPVDVALVKHNTSCAVPMSTDGIVVPSVRWKDVRSSSAAPNGFQRDSKGTPTGFRRGSKGIPKGLQRHYAIHSYSTRMSQLNYWILLDF